MKKFVTLPSGFTLIELVVVIAIMVVLSGTSIAAYYRFSQKQSALNDARNLATEMKKIQALARNLVYPAGCTNLSSYNLFSDCNGGCQTMSANAVCGSGLYSALRNDPVLSKGLFQSNINISFGAGTGSISPAIGAYSVTAAGDPYQVEVTTDLNGNIDVKEL